MADWAWIEKFVWRVRNFDVPEVDDVFDLPHAAAVRAAVQGSYAPHPDCSVLLDGDGRPADLDHGQPVHPFVPATFLIAGVSPLGFVCGAIHIADPWTSEPGTVHVEHFDGPIALHRFNTTLGDASDAIRLNHDEFTDWYAQHRVTFQ